jgi:predicted translin family RNA/ssDNA-binding protein
MGYLNLQNLIESKRGRLKLYLEREIYMLSPDAVRAYGIGSRNLQRYDTALKDILDMIKKLEDEIAELELIAEGKTPRRAVAVVPRDW